MPNTLSKKQRLNGEIKIKTLFQKGNIIIAYPLRICYLSTNDEDNQMMVSVPKKTFKRAVKRNLLKRRIREAYRLNKHILDQLTTEKGAHIQIAFSYISPDISSFEQIQHSVVKAFRKIKL